MRILAGLGMGALLLVGVAVGLRLLALWRRTRQLPELMIAVGLVLCTGFPVIVVGARVQASRPTLGAACVALGVLSLGLAGLSTALFTYRVFRRGQTWARLLAVALGVGLIGLWLARAVTTDFRFAGAYDAISYGAALLRFAALAWASAESLLYWQRMRRRLRLGLADPVVTNRFALWGVGIGCGAVGSALGVVVMRMGLDAPGSDPVFLAISLLGLVAAAALWLAFLPTAGFRRWLERRAPSGP